MNERKTNLRLHPEHYRVWEWVFLQEQPDVRDNPAAWGANIIAFHRECSGGRNAMQPSEMHPLK